MVLISDEHHDLAMLLMRLLEYVLLHMDLVVDKADELHISKVNTAYRHLLLQMDDGDLAIFGNAVFVSEQGVLDYESLRGWLRVLKKF